MKPALYLLVLCFASSTHPRQPAGLDIVCWQENRKLGWADFQSITRPVLTKEETLPNSVLCATTEANAVVYDLNTDTGTFVKTLVRVEFDKRKSWINKATYDDRKATLIHEQLHFDIVELTGRKIRRILVKQPDVHSATVTAAITQAYAEEAARQHQCDKQTQNGNDLKAQARWQMSIKKQLAALAPYKSTPADCDIPQ